MAVAAMAASSAGGEFSITPDNQLVNWTSGYTANITITNISATQNVSFNVWNLTSPVINGWGLQAPFTVAPSNSSWLNGSSTQVTLVFLTGEIPWGRYTGAINVSDATNATESTTVGITLDVPVATNQAGLTTIRGNATASTWDLFYVNMTSVQAYGIRVNFTNANVLPLILKIYDGSGSLLRTTADFGLPTNSTQLDYTSARTGYWLLNFTTLSVPSGFNASVELLEASMLGNGVPAAVTVTNKTSRGYSTTLMTYFWLNNSADYDVNITGVTSSLLNLTTDSSKNMQFLLYNITAPWNLSANNGTLVAANISVNTLNTSNTEGNYVGWMAFTTDRGYPSSNLNVTFTINLTSALTLDGITFANESGGTMIAPGAKLNINVIPRWQNGTAVPNINPGNFSAWITHQNSSRLGSAANLSLTLNGSVAWNNSHYLLNTTLPSGALGGTYTLYVSAWENTSLNGGTGATAANALMVNDSALRLTLYNAANSVEITESSIGLSGGSTVNFYASVTNYGTKTATAVNVTRGSASCGTASGDSTVGATIGIGDLAAGASNSTGSTTSNRWTYTAPNSTTSCTLVFTANAGGTAWDRQNVTLTFSVTVSGGSGTTGDSSSSGQQGQESNTTQTTSNPTTEMTILDWPKETYVVQGASQSFSVRVKNSGTTQLDDVMVAIEGVTSGWWSSVDKHMLPRGTFSDWNAAFSIPATAPVANYSITFVANNPKTTARATGLLIVTPGPATQEEIRNNITNMTDAFAAFQKELEKMKTAGKDVAQANASLGEAFALLKQAGDSVASSNWLAAFNQLAAARVKFDDAHVKLTGASKATASAVLPGAFDFSTAGLLVGVFMSGVGLAGTAVWLAIEKGILKLRKGVLPSASSGPKSIIPGAKQKSEASPLKKLLERMRRKKPTAYHWRPGDSGD
jgi:hypothetical protein